MDTDRTPPDHIGQDRPMDKTDPLNIIGMLIVSKYRIESYIGHGGFGDVYGATNQKLFGQRVVIKFLWGDDAIDHFRLEAAIQANLDHPNICQVTEYLIDQRAIVIPFIDGTDCGRLLKQAGPFQEERVEGIASALLSALVYAHKSNVAHRDLKPSNIMIDSHSHVRLIDFGIAKQTTGNTKPEVRSSGTNLYMPPEQESDDSINDPIQRDIYALGCTLFELFTNKHLKEVAKDGKWGGDEADLISPGFQAVIRKATHPEVSERFQSMEEMQLAFLKRNQLLPVDNDVKESDSRRWLWFAVPVLLVVVVVVGLAILRPDLLSRSNTSERDNVDSIKNSVTVQNDLTKDSEELDTIPSVSESIVVEIPLKIKKVDTVNSEAGDTENDQEVITTAPELPIVNISAITPEQTVPDSISVRLSVFTPGSSVVEFDRKAVASDGSIRTIEGEHSLRVIHPRFPVLDHSIEIHQDTTLKINLARMFANTKRFSLKIGMNPYPTNSEQILLNLNGAETVVSAIGQSIDDLIAGPWRIEMALLNSRGRIDPGLVIDSFAITTNRPSPRQVCLYSRTTFDFGTIDWNKNHFARLIIYWSRQ